MVVRRSEHYLNNELSISTTGVYTRAHLYRHPKTGREVKLIGMLHTAEPDYYTQVKNELLACDVVLYEYIEDNSGNDQVADDGQEIRNSHKEDFLMAIIQSYFAALDTRPIDFLMGEGAAFSSMRQRENWFCADFFHEDSERAHELQRRVSDTMLRRIRRISEDRAFKAAFFLGDAIVNIKKEIFTKRDFARTIKIIFDRDLLGNIIDRDAIKQRDTFCFDRFDEVIKTHAPKLVGIKYGVAHMHNQKRLLKKRGYEHISSKKLFCVRF
ncbi:MAG: hypothetical protein R3251_01780 [Candidatus Spechtbacterales bacterium]|nr:hypothetical protein [Candidatus Spechtbacterales bacterium]